MIIVRYFEGGVCSVYLWDLDHGFAGVILIKKAGDTDRIKGCWDSIHVVEVQEKAQGRSAHYKLTSTVMLWLQVSKLMGTMAQYTVEPVNGHLGDKSQNCFPVS